MQPKITQIALNDIWIVRRDAKYFIHYDAGAHQHFWREDEIAAHDAQQIWAAVPSAAIAALTKGLWQIQQQQPEASRITATLKLAARYKKRILGKRIAFTMKLAHLTNRQLIAALKASIVPIMLYHL